MLPGKTPLQALAETPVANLVAQCERATRAAQLITATLGDAGFPDGAPSIACQFKEHVLLIFAQSAAQAGKLRQATPRFLTALREQGMNVSEIRIRVQAAELTEANDPVSAGSRVDSRDFSILSKQSNAAKEFAEKLALTLRPSALRDAANRLARVLRDFR
jgi:hypothetical protein